MELRGLLRGYVQNGEIGESYRNAKVLETFYTLANTTTVIKSEIEMARNHQSAQTEARTTLMPTLDQTLAKELNLKKLERKAKECVLNYFENNN